MRVKYELVLGILLFLAAFGALYLLANVINPPEVRVLVAVEEIKSGDNLVPEMARFEEVSIPDVALYITEKDLAEFGTAVAIEAVHRGELLQKASFVVQENPAAENRTALALHDPAMAAFVVPVNFSTAPPGISRGDLVDVIFGIGGEKQMMGQALIESRPTAEVAPEMRVQLEADTAELNVLTNEWVEEADQEGSENGSFADQEIQSIQPDPAVTTEVPIVEQGQREEVLLPISKVLVRCARVLEVVYEPPAGSAYGATGEAVHQRGEMTALVLEIPVEAQELLTFALANGEVRVGLRSPLAGADQPPTMGMSWNDLASFFALERMAAMALWDDGQEVVGPGANLKESILNPIPQFLPPESYYVEEDIELLVEDESENP